MSSHVFANNKKKAFLFTVSVSDYESYNYCQIHTNLCPTFFSLGILHMQLELLRITSVDFFTVGQWLIRFSLSVSHRGKCRIITAQYSAVYRF
jgi:hypothetical protein